MQWLIQENGGLWIGKSQERTNNQKGGDEKSSDKGQKMTKRTGQFCG